MMSQRLNCCNSKSWGRILLISLLTLGSQSYRMALAAEQSTITLTSPSGAVALTVSLRPVGNSSQLVYKIHLDNKLVILDSAIALELADHSNLGKQTEFMNSSVKEVSERFRQSPGKRLIIKDHYRELVLSLVENDSTQRRWEFIARVYEDGVAFRYRFPKQADWDSLELAKELTQFTFPSRSKIIYLPLSGFITSHEGLYDRSLIESLPANQLVDIPLLADTPSGVWIAVAEANLTNYSGMFLKKIDSGRTLTSELSPRIEEMNLAVERSLPAESPWRVILIAKEAKDLVESDLTLKLNAPPMISDMSWIRPGKTTFPWWNGFYEEHVSSKPGLNTAFAKHYIDFCADYGIPYHTLDGIDNTAWYGGPIVPYEGNDPTTAIEGLDLQEILRYASKKGVRLRLWLHWQAAQAHMHRAFPLYSKWGVEGVMIDFMDRNDQEMIEFQRELLQLAAANQLTVNFHGAAPPSGLERTFPNLLNTEAVMNLEYNKWNEKGIPPNHDVTVPFTRMLAGPLDYHQGSFRTVPGEDFRPQDVAPLVIGTPCRTLASFVVLHNHLPMLADYPTMYRGNELTHVAARIPATWDETVVLVGEVGKKVAIGRRSRDDWWIGVMTDNSAADVDLSLELLGQGKFHAEIYQDNSDISQKFQRTDLLVTSSDKLELSLAKAGGALVHLTPIPLTPSGWRLVWSDDFERLDRSKWLDNEELSVDKHSQVTTNPELLSVKNGILSLGCPATSSKKIGRAYTTFSQRFGRWEVRAKLPSSSDIQAVFRLLPDVAWPSGGEIDMMTYAGQPHITNSEFHWGSIEPFFHDSRVISQRASVGGALDVFSDAFHTYAVEWTDDQLRFYVDGVHHTTFYSDEVGDFLPKLVNPMNLSIETRATANGESASLSRGQSRDLLVDWVRVYEGDTDPKHRQFFNGGFEASGGALSGWHIFGNKMTSEPNVKPAWQQSRTGLWSLSISGPSNGDETYSGVSQGIGVESAQLVRAKIWVKVDSHQSLINTDNYATLKVEFYKRVGDYFGGPGMLGFKEIVIADRETLHDVWREHEITLEAPAGAVEARLSIVFAQKESKPGMAFIDDVEFTAQDN